MGLPIGDHRYMPQPKSFGILRRLSISVISVPSVAKII